MILWLLIHFVANISQKNFLKKKKQKTSQNQQKTLCRKIQADFKRKCEFVLYNQDDFFSHMRLTTGSFLIFS